VPWLVKEDKVLASVETARPRRGPLLGAIGEQQIVGALMIAPARAAHSLRGNRAIDFAFLGLAHGEDHKQSTEECEYRVLRVVALEPNRITKPELRAVAALEAEAGAFERWGLVEGDTIRIELRQ